MATVHTAHGPGEIVASETTRGRTHFKVAVTGTSTVVWMDETEVNRRTAAGEDLFSFKPEMDAMKAAGSYHPGEHHAPQGHGMYGDTIEAARGFDFEPSLHTWDNETVLPYNPHDGQYPVDMFRHEQTQSPDHQLDSEKRLRPTKSVSGEPGPERPKKGPAAHLFAGLDYPSHNGMEADWEDAYPDPEHELHHGPGGGIREYQGDRSDTDPYDHGYDEDAQDRHHGAYEPAITNYTREHPQRDREEAAEGHGEDPDRYVPESHFGMRSEKFVRLHQAADYNDPIQRFRNDPVGTIQRTASFDLDAGLDPEVGANQLYFANLDERTIEGRREIEASWRDVAAKAKRLRHEGHVDVQDISHDRIYAKVAGDHGIYETMIAKGNDYTGGQSVSNWRCSCDWGKWAFKRQFTFVGRLCSHAYAAYQEMQSHHIKNDKSHPFHNRRRKLKASNDNEGDPKASLSNFKKWIKDENGDHLDLDAADRYMSTSENPMDKELAQSIYDYASGHVSERPERDFDQDGYHYGPDDSYKTADLLSTSPRKMSPDLVVVPTHEGDDAHYFTDLGDDRETTGPGQIQASWYTAKVPGEHHPAFAWHDDKEDDFPESGIVHFSARDSWYRQAAPGDPDSSGGSGVSGLEKVLGLPSTAPAGPAMDPKSVFPAGGGFSPQNLPGVAGGQNTPAAAPPSDPTGGTMTNQLPKPPAPAPGGAAPAAGKPQGPGGAGSWSGPGKTQDGWSGGGKTVTVKPGDTLSGIDQANGLGNGSSAYNDVAKSNGIANPNQITPGQQIKLPGAGGGGGAAAPSAGWGLGDVAGPKATPAAGVGGSALASPGSSGASGKIPSIPLGTGATSGIKAHREAERFAAFYFQADDGLDTAPDDDKRKAMPGAPPPVGEGAGYKSTAPSGGAAPKLPAGDNGVSSQSSTGNGPTGTWVAGPKGPVDTSGKGGAGAAAQQSASGGGTGGDAATKDSGPLNANPLGGGGGAGSFMDKVAPIAGGIAQGIGGLVPGLSGIMSEVGPALSGIGHLFGSNDAERFAMRYFQADGDFLDDGGGDWADHPFAGSGPIRKDWIGSSEDYVEEHERPERQETWVTDNTGDVVNYTTERPRQRPKQAAADHFALEYTADAYNPGEQGYFNPSNRPYQEDDSDQYKGDKPHGQEGGRSGGDAPSANDAAGIGGEAEGGAGALGELAEVAPLLVANNHFAMEVDDNPATWTEQQILASKARPDDASDIVRQFQASQGAAALMTSAGPSQASGAYSDDAIAGAAQAFLQKKGGMQKTAGRVFSQAEQRALEEESHPLGARNLGGLDLAGTHYE